MPTISQFLLTFLLNAAWLISLVALITMACAKLLRNLPAPHHLCYFFLKGKRLFRTGHFLASLQQIKIRWS